MRLKHKLAFAHCGISLLLLFLLLFFAGLLSVSFGPYNPVQFYCTRSAFDF